MSYLPIALLSYFLNSIALTVDKFLLTKSIPDPLIYIFYFSLVSFLLTLAIPFTHIPSFTVFILSSTSTLAWTVGAYCMFRALKYGQVQRVIPVIGTVTPLVLLIFAAGSNSIDLKQTEGIILSVIGLVFLTLGDLKGKLAWDELILEISSGFFFALAYFLLRLAFLQDSFFTVLVWSRPILIPLGIILLMIPASRNKILPMLHPRGVIQKAAPVFIFGQIAAGTSELLLTFSISLTNPAVVNSLQGIKYIYLLIFSLILGKKYPEIFKTKLSGYFLLSQIVGIAFIGLGLYLLAI